MQRLAMQYQQASGYTIHITFQDAADMADALAFAVLHNLTNLYDGWVASPSSLSVLAAHSWLLPLDARVAADVDLDWPDIHPYFQLMAGVQHGHVVGLPLSGQMATLAYRRDVLTSHRLAVPATWEELLDVAAALNGSDFDGDGLGDFALCLQLSGNCPQAGVALGQVLAPMTQYQGSAAGWLFDPSNLATFASGNAMEVALGVYRRLLAYDWPEVGCRTDHRRFAAGQCAITIVHGVSIKLSHLNATLLHGNLGTAPLPGHAAVYDRGASGALVACDALLCPHAERAVTAAGRVQWVNRSPYAGVSTWGGGVNVFADPDIQDAMYGFLSFASSGNASAEALLDVASPAGPFRLSQMRPSALEPYWSAAGHAGADAADFLSAWLHSLGSANVALDLRLPGSQAYQSALQHLAFAAVESDSIEQLLNDAGVSFHKILATSGGSDVALPAYRSALGVSPVASATSARVTEAVLCQPLAPAAPLAPRPPRPNSAPASPLPGGAIAGIIVGTFVTLCVVVMAVLSGAQPRWGRQGTVDVPQAGPHTTLLLSDIEDSTALWEALSSEVMGRVIKLHNDTFREYTDKFGGYESQTEGDAFILSFHEPSVALKFAVEVQHALLACPWPMELLRMDTCCPRWAVQSPDATFICHNSSRGLRSLFPRSNSLPDRRASLQLTNELLGLEIASSSTGGGAGSVTADDDALSSRHDSHRLLSRLRTISSSLVPTHSPPPHLRNHSQSNSQLTTQHTRSDACIAARLRAGDTSLFTHSALYPMGGGSSTSTRPRSATVESGADQDIVLGDCASQRSLRGGSMTGHPALNASMGADNGVGGLGGVSRTPSHTSRLRDVLLRQGVTDAQQDIGSSLSSARSSSAFARDALASRPPSLISPNGKLRRDLQMMSSSARRLTVDVSSPRSPRELASLWLPQSATSSCGGGGGFDRMSDCSKGGAAGEPAAEAGVEGGEVVRVPSPPQDAAAPRRTAPQVSLPATLVSEVHVPADLARDSEASLPCEETFTVCEHWQRAWECHDESYDIAELIPQPRAKNHVPRNVAAGGGGDRLSGSAVGQPLLAFRGLRVRIGVSCGFDEADVTLNKTTSRTQYGGRQAAIARGVCDAARGGMILLSEAAFQRLTPAVLRKDCIIINMGEHMLKDTLLPPAMIYQVLGVHLMQRCAFMGRVRTRQPLQSGLEDAPLGWVTVVFMNVADLPSLMAWNKDVTEAALATFHSVAVSHLLPHRGYLVELSEGLCLATFLKPADAVRWACTVTVALQQAAWPPQLLTHELSEEVLTGPASAGHLPSGQRDVLPDPAEIADWPTHHHHLAASPVGNPIVMVTPLNFSILPAAAMQERRVVPSFLSLVTTSAAGPHLQRPATKPPSPHLSQMQQQQQRPQHFSDMAQVAPPRGLKLKVGIDVGQVKSVINCTTGRMAYRGRTMNRASRISGCAVPGQVTCSAAVHASCMDGNARHASRAPIACTAIGKFALKGVSEQVELYSCQLPQPLPSPPPSAACRSRRACDLQQTHSEPLFRSDPSLAVSVEGRTFCTEECGGSRAGGGGGDAGGLQTSPCEGDDGAGEEVGEDPDAVAQTLGGSVRSSCNVSGGFGGAVSFGRCLVEGLSIAAGNTGSKRGGGSGGGVGHTNGRPHSSGGGSGNSSSPQLDAGQSNSVTFPQGLGVLGSTVNLTGGKQSSHVALHV